MDALNLEVPSEATLSIDVFDRLTQMGLHTPVTEHFNSHLDQLHVIERSVKQIMSALSLDLDDPSLKGTPKRLAKMWVNELCFGLNWDNFPRIMRIPAPKHAPSSFVLQSNISVMSLCEHHFQTIDGYCHVAYVPHEYVIGLSKLNRIVDFFSRRPQIQERLTAQIVQAVSVCTGSPDVAVYLEASHYCVKARGCKDHSSSMVTLECLGKFQEGRERDEFLQRTRHE